MTTNPYRTVPNTRANWQPVTRTEYDALEERKRQARRWPAEQRQRDERAALLARADELIEDVKSLRYEAGEIVELAGKSYRVGVYSPLTSSKPEAMRTMFARGGFAAQLWLTPPNGSSMYLANVDASGRLVGCVTKI